MSADALVSVIIPTYYRNNRLPEAIESALAQTYEPIEVIVVDDSGEAHAESVTTDYDATYVAHEENRGGNPARNTGLDMASGEYVQFLDDDDRIDEQKIERQVDVIHSSPEVGVVYCGLEYEDGGQVLPAPEVRGDVLEHALSFSMNPCQTGTMLIDGDLVNKIYPLRTRRAADDIGMKIRLAKRTHFEFTEQVLFSKGASESHRSSKIAFADELEVIIDEFDREYSMVDSSIVREARRELNRGRGYRLLENRNWSFEAICSFGRALRYTKGIDPMLTGAFLASFLGSPGHRVSAKLWSFIN